jgi:hypothetical protein
MLDVMVQVRTQLHQMATFIGIENNPIARQPLLEQLHLIGHNEPEFLRRASAAKAWLG